MLRYASYNPKDGSILEVVAMSRDEDMRARQARGETLISLDPHQNVNPRIHRIVNGRIELKPATAQEVKARISSDLARTDRYFMADALENVTAEEQAKWRAYRQRLRAVHKMDSVQEMLVALPTDVKGADNYADLRGRPIS